MAKSHADDSRAPTEPATPQRERNGGPPSSIIGGRLAAATDGSPVPTWDDLGLTEAKRVAFAWQQQRSRSRLNELAVLLKDGDASEWVRELHGLIGVVGELLLVTIEAEVEKEILSRRLAELSPADDGALPSRASAGRSLRFFAEGQGNQLTIAGHSLANLTVRTLALHPRFDIEPIANVLGVKASRFKPGSSHRKAWTSLTPDTAAAMLASSRLLGTSELVDMTEALERLVLDPDVAALRSARNDQYHRWRGESPGVTGINFGDLSMQARLRRGEVVGFGRELLPSYDEGQAVVDDLVRMSRAALDAYAKHMSSFLTTWFDAFEGAIPQA